MSAIEKIKAKARADVKHIVLPEGTEPRTVQASAKILKEGVARVTLLGNPDEVRKVAAETGTDLTGVAIIDPATSEKSAAYADLLYELRKAKGMTPEQATELVTKNPLYYGAVMLKAGDADGMVAGAINSTGNVLRPALQIIKTAPGIKVVSSCFIMELPDPKWGDNGVMIFGDCAVIPNPTAEELAAIAIASAASGKQLVDIDPRVAMLSFSTKGSAKHDNVTKVQEATEAWPTSSRPNCSLTASFRRTPRWWKASASSSPPAAPWRAMPMCWCSPTCRPATSATSWCSAWRARRPSAPSSRAWPSP